MSYQLPGIAKRSPKVAFAATLLALCLTASASAQNDCWTAAGSDGTPDEADRNQYETNLNAVSVSAGLAAAQVVMRYNVTAVNGVFGPGKELRIRYTDNGADARVVARLRLTNINTGAGAVVATFDSDSFPQTGSQTQSIVFNCAGPELDFLANVYFVEVTLIKTGAGGAPSLRALRICGGATC